MIFAIGDIHGLYDPLKVLADYIHQVASQGEKITAIVFLGDYIDCGPSSREVVDLVLEMKKGFPVVTLLGNHEEMLLSFYHKTFDYVRSGNFWMSYNGGLQTVRSFYPESLLFSNKKTLKGKSVAEKLVYDDVLKLEPKYEDFLNGLQCSYQVSLTKSGQAVDLLFTHSVPNPRFPLQSQTSITDWKGLRAFIAEQGCEIDETLIWNRQLLTAPLEENLTVIHGHTPTRYYIQMKRFLRQWEDTASAPYVVRDKKKQKLIQIDIDNGLVYGGTLTMLAIDDDPAADKVFPYFVSIDPKHGYRNRQFSKTELDLG